MNLNLDAQIVPSVNDSILNSIQTSKDKLFVWLSWCFQIWSTYPLFQSAFQICCQNFNL